MFTPPDFTVRGSALEYLEWLDDGPRLLHASSTGSAWVPLPPAESYWPQAAGDGFRLLARSGGDTPLVRITTATGEVLPLFLPPLPDGVEFFACGGGSFGVDAHGRVLAGVRNSQAAWLVAWAPGTSGWVFVGRPMADVQGVDVVASQGEFVTLYTPREPGSCGEEALPFVDPPADAFVEGEYQLIGLDSGLAVATDALPEVDPTHVCAMWGWPAERVVLDLADGETLSLPRSVHAGWFD